MWELILEKKYQVLVPIQCRNNACNNRVYLCLLKNPPVDFSFLFHDCKEIFASLEKKPMSNLDNLDIPKMVPIFKTIVIISDCESFDY